MLSTQYSGEQSQMLSGIALTLEMQNLWLSVDLLAVA